MRPQLPIALLWAIMYDPSGVIGCDAYTNIFISPVGAGAIIAHGSAVGIGGGVNMLVIISKRVRPQMSF
ncbi:MAG: hypothetical protein ACYDHG_10620 [Desulfomonilaceae bacterium]